MQSGRHYRLIEFYTHIIYWIFHLQVQPSLCLLVANRHILDQHQHHRHHHQMYQSVIQVGGDQAQDQDGSNIKKNDTYIHSIGIFKKVLWP